MTKAPAFQYYPGDFDSDTASWTIEEVGIYQRLLNSEWMNGALPNETQRLALIARCSHEQFLKFWDTVKRKFFENGDGFLYNKRLEETRKMQMEYRKLKSKAGKISGLKRYKTNRKATQDPTEAPTEGEQNSNREGNRNPTLQSSSSSSSSTPSSDSSLQSSEEKLILGEDENELGESSPQILARDLFDEYQKINVKLPKPKAFTSERLRKCRVRIRDPNFLPDFRKAVRMAQEIPFLCGDNDRGWTADFDWFIDNGTNVVKVIEGKYSRCKKSDMQKVFEETMRTYGPRGAPDEPG